MTGPERTAVLLTPSLRRGGAEAQVMYQALGMRKRGWGVAVICLTEIGAVERAQELQSAGVQVSALGLRTRRNAAASMVRGVVRLAVELRRLRPQVIECFMYHGHVLGVPVARFLGVPAVVSSFHVLSDVKPNVHLAKSLVRPLERYADRRVQSVICPSQAVRDDVASNVAALAEKLQVLPYGVPLAAWSPPAFGPPARILVIANLHPYKGHAVLLEAFAEALRRTSPEAAQLELAGSGSEELALREIATDLGIEANVAFLGTVTDIAERLSSCAFTILPSFTEALPVAVLESLAAGRAVIASRVGGVPEILDDGGGIMVPPGDPPALADAICAFLDDPARIAALGAEGRNVVASRFGLRHLVDGRVDLYEKLLRGRLPGDPTGAAGPT